MGDPAALDLQDWLLYSLQQFIDGIDVGEWANSQTWIWAWMLAELISLPALPQKHHQGELSSTTLASSPSAATGEGQGQLSCCHDSWASSANCLRW